jgi:uncharacterized protein
MRALSHVIGVDDAPFAHDFRGNVLVVGTVYSRLRIEGVLSTKVRRDGRNATGALVKMIASSQFADHVHVVLLQGIALGGFNVVDIHALAKALGVGVLVVARRKPDLAAMRDALFGRVHGFTHPEGERKWRLIEQAGPMEPVHGVFVQRADISIEEATMLLARLAVNGKVPEPLRVAHLIAGGVTTGRSRGRA